MKTRGLIEFDLTALSKEQVETFKSFAEDLLNDDPYNAELETVVNDINFYIDNMEMTDEFTQSDEDELN
jgi:hypothetical protein